MAAGSDIKSSITDLFHRFGATNYDDTRREPVSSLEHALQCAQLAELADASPSLVLAALLHDIGHHIESGSSGPHCDDVHELRAVPFLAGAFGPSVIEPIRLHVQAKRYLVAVDTAYVDSLSAASKVSLLMQGGAMCEEELGLFERLPFSREAVALRRWDDLAKDPGKRTPPLAHFLRLVD